MDDEVTLWLQGLARGESSAVQHIWERYYGQLMILASRKLQRHNRRAADEEDLALSAFHSFCQGANAGRFPQLNDRHDLWKLMLTITARKASAVMRRDRRQKRGGGLVRGDSVFMRPGESEDAAGIDQVAGSQPTPEFAVQVAEQCERLLQCLPDDQHRDLALKKLEGYTTLQVAEQLNCTPRTVERKLARIRESWQELLNEDE